MHVRTGRQAAAAFFALAPALSYALTPSEVFDKVSPSIYAVRALDAQERPFSHGSAVVVGPGQLVTNCHVLAKAKGIQLRRENVIYEAKLEHADVERDLCLLSVKNLSAPSVTVGSLDRVKVGQRVFAIGNPAGLTLTLSEGLVSALRGDEGKPLLQTTAPISPGSSGGGLFDEQGNLLGITSFGVVNRQRTSQNLNFAVPAEWIAEVPERAKALIAKRAERPAPGAPAGVKSVAGMPTVGASWKYSFKDRQYSTPERVFTIRVEGVDAATVRETLSVADGATSAATVDVSAIAFSPRSLYGDYSLMELAPYFFSSERGAAPAAHRPSGYPRGTWQVSTATVQSESIVVPAGTYKAVRVDISGSILSRPPGVDETSQHVPSRFTYTAWYAPEVNRYVMVRHQTWNRRSQQVGDELVQLLEFKR